MFEQPVRRAALIAGLAYLAMTVIAFATAFDAGLLDATPEGVWPEATVSALTLSLYGLAAIAALDIVIAWALVSVFADKSRPLVLVMSISRVVYVAFFAIGLVSLNSARIAMTDGGAADVARGHFASFEWWWDIGFLFFADHLVLLGVLFLGIGRVHTILAVLLMIAGLGYLADSGLALAGFELGFAFAPFTFLGELLFIAWLFVRAFRA